MLNNLSFASSFLFHTYFYLHQYEGKADQRRSWLYARFILGPRRVQGHQIEPGGHFKACQNWYFKGYSGNIQDIRSSQEGISKPAWNFSFQGVSWRNIEDIKSNYEGISKPAEKIMVVIFKGYVYFSGKKEVMDQVIAAGRDSDLILICNTSRQQVWMTTRLTQDIEILLETLI